MNDSSIPRPFEEWRTDEFSRREDAAYTFGFHLMEHCRAEALKFLQAAPGPQSAEELNARAVAAVDVALHNVMDLLEGFWPTQAGPNHNVSYALAVCVSNQDRQEVERIEISPCHVDLPIGYWKFKEGEFR